MYLTVKTTPSPLLSPLPAAHFCLLCALVNRRSTKSTMRGTARRAGTRSYFCCPLSRYATTGNAESGRKTNPGSKTCSCSRGRSRVVSSTRVRESIQADLRETSSSRSVSSCGMGPPSSRADRRSRRAVGALEWFRAWLWVLLWTVLTSGVEPSQRAVGGTTAPVDPQVTAPLLWVLFVFVSLLSVHRVLRGLPRKGKVQLRPATIQQS